MQDFIQGMAEKLGVSTEAVGAATGGLLGLIKDNADGADVSEMLAKLPGADALIESASAGGGSGGGVLGAIGGALGGGAGQALGAVEALTKGGLSMDQLGSFLDLFKQYVEPLLGSDLLKRLLSSVPGLDSILG